MANSLLQVTDLKKYFYQGKATVKAVDGVTFQIDRNETFGMVGESGSGKTTVARAVLRLHEPTSGQVVFDGRDVLALPDREVRALRREMQIIFQDPLSSLNPMMSVGTIIEDALKIHGIGTRAEREEEVRRLLDLVGVGRKFYHAFPHEFSGGQQQRVGIARALALKPRFIVCDEPVSSLDLSIQAQILNLLEELQERFGLAYLFISHNLKVVEHLSDVVGVMYLGKLVEVGDTEAIYRRPAHPYTQILLASAPQMDPGARSKRILLEGEVPSPIDPPSGCPFHPRCPHRMARCSEEVPVLKQIGSGHQAACFLT
ncbi:MAG: ATP-binding cassette domain-containing protein [Candidatus Latescibacteria bacterium]|nr:ATP-binding cassette domain-containing protein [Candidatus Latescibacterota bacterium]